MLQSIKKVAAVPFQKFDLPLGSVWGVGPVAASLELQETESLRIFGAPVKHWGRGLVLEFLKL